MHKITKGLKKKKKGKKSKKNKEEELFKPEELEAYRREHQQAHETLQGSESAAVDSEEWKKFNALTTGIDNILKKTQGDLDRIKSTSFFQRVPPPSELKKKEEEELAQQQLRKEAEARRVFEEQQKPLSATEAAIVPVSESESEDEDEDDIFDTTYIDVIAAGEVKLAYIPESPNEEPEGDDPFDTSIAERAILGPSVERKGKKLVPIGAAVEILTGRVQAPTCVPTKRPVSRRPILKEADLLLGNFDGNANSFPDGGGQVDKPPTSKPSLLDDDAPSELTSEPIDLTKNLHFGGAEQQKPKDILSEFDVIAIKSADEDVDDEFALLAAESLSKKAAVNTFPLVSTVPQISKESWNAFGEEKPAKLDAVDDDYEDDPFDTTFADNILPGKAELKVIENEILNDANFNPRAEEIYPDVVKSQVSIQLTNPTGQRESISSLDRVSESELNLIQPIHRDLLGGSSTDLSNLGDQPLRPKEPVDENYIEYCDPFDTSIVETAKLPGQTELKFLERELLGDIETVRPGSLSDDDFDPRAEESTKHNVQNRKVSFELPLGAQGLLGARPEEKTLKPLTPYYVRENSIPELDDVDDDPFDTSFVSEAAPGKAELKIIENELFKPTSDLDDQHFDPRDDKQVSIAKVVQTIKEISDPNVKPKPNPIDLCFEEVKQVDLLAVDNDVSAKVLTPAAEVSADFSALSYTDPFDTSIASNILPGKTELKLLESELIHSRSPEVKLKEPDIFAKTNVNVQIKPLTPQASHTLSLEVGDDVDPFDTSIASNIKPGRTELKLIESELI